jgi:hypothetical protein
MSADAPIQSGRFLLEETDPADVFIPEHFDPDETMLSDAVGRFVRDKVLPRMDELDAQKEGLLRDLLRQAGALGVFMVDVPEAMGGLGATKKAGMRVAEKLGEGGSFGPAALVQAGIGGLPLVLFGTDAQRQAYLPRIVSGEMITAYALTEAGSGSDALAARSTAVWDASRDAYRLNGSKQFITNAGIADLFIVFAKVDGERFTCFLVEKGAEGLSTGAEERKMGLRGSSTRSLVFDDVSVPRDRVLGDVGQGHRIAFSVLNIGRLKLAPAVLGGAKNALREGVRYAKGRTQFGKPLAAFPLIQQKVAEAAVLIYCAESMCYRSADLIDRLIEASLEAGEGDPARATVAALKEFVLECSVNKVYASECLDRVVDEMLQIHGGYGYIQDYAVERAYRDARINRIWEGTSEINRMIIAGTLVERAAKGSLPLLSAVRRITEELMSRRREDDPAVGGLAVERGAIRAAKKMTLFSAGYAAQIFSDRLEKEQEILAWTADMVIQTFAMESACLRTLKLASGGDRLAGEMEARQAAVSYAVETGLRVVEDRARHVLAASAAGEELRSMLSMLKRLARREPLHVAAAGRKVAAFVIERDGEPFA